MTEVVSSENIEGAQGRLLSPLALGQKVMPNRIVFGSHLTNFGQGNLFTPRHLAYYRARAGAGLIVTENMAVHPQDWPYEHIPFAYRDDIIPSLETLATEVRSHGDALLLGGLSHTGGQCSGRVLRQSPWAPSPVADVASRKMAREMEVSEIEAVIAGFGEAAERVGTAGLDGVEINAAQHSLLRQFLSPLTNFRGDDWGGELPGRMRILREVLKKVRGVLGPEKIMGVRLCGDEFAPWGGLTPENAAEIAEILTAEGGLDYLSVQVGGPYSVHLTDPAMPTEEGFGTEQARVVKEKVSCPVFAEGKVENLEHPKNAEALLVSNGADAVVMTRALVSDPDLVAKWGKENPEPIRRHVAMTRYFSVRGDWNRPLGDLVNPLAGRENINVYSPTAKAPALVIGGGPAGMQAAITLRKAGHPVTLWEGGSALGGMAGILAQKVPSRKEFSYLVEDNQALLTHLGVEVELNRKVSGLTSEMERFDRIFLATGAAAPATWEIPTKGLAPPIESPRSLLVQENPLKPGKAVILDEELGFRMAAAVEFLLAGGFQVEIVTRDFQVGRELVESAELLWFNRVVPAGVVFHPRSWVKSIEKNTLVLADRFSLKETPVTEVTLIVEARPETPADFLLEKLQSSHPSVQAVGDARAPRLMGEATQNAHRTVVKNS